MLQCLHLRKAGVLLFASAIIGCGNPHENIADSDPEVTDTFQDARETFVDEFIEVMVASMNADIESDLYRNSGFLAKVGFRKEEVVEEFWLNSIQANDARTSFTGRLEITDQPTVIDVEPGGEVSFELDQVTDWMYTENVEEGLFVVGGHTIQLERSRMTQEERDAHDDLFPYKFREPSTSEP